MSKQVKKRYYRLPTAARYGVGSERGVPEVKEMVVELVGKGVRTSFASTIFVRMSRS